MNDRSNKQTIERMKIENPGVGRPLWGPAKISHHNGKRQKSCL